MHGINKKKRRRNPAQCFTAWRIRYCATNNNKFLAWRGIFRKSVSGVLQVTWDKPISVTEHISYICWIIKKRGETRTTAAKNRKIQKTTSWRSRTNNSQGATEKNEEADTCKGKKKKKPFSFAMCTVYHHHRGSRPENYGIESTKSSSWCNNIWLTATNFK